jgi:hypothetical protein
MSEPWLRLYPRLLGPAWSALPEPVRRCHEALPVLRATGDFFVRRGRSWLARVLAPLMRLPRAAESVRLELTVRAFADRQVWSRDFEGRKLVTVQSALDDGRMVEKTLLFEVAFRVHAEEGAVVYVPAGVRFVVGPLRLPLPRWLGPRISARAWALPGEPGMRVEVSIAAPLAGHLVTYGGLLVPQT